MNEVKLIEVSNSCLSDLDMQGEINERLKYFKEDEYRLINIQIISEKRAYVTLQSKY